MDVPDQTQTGLLERGGDLRIGDVRFELHEDFARGVTGSAGWGLDGGCELAVREEGGGQKGENGKAAGKKCFHDWIGRLIVGTVIYSQAAQRSFTESNDASSLSTYAVEFVLVFTNG